MRDAIRLQQALRIVSKIRKDGQAFACPLFIVFVDINFAILGAVVKLGIAI